MAPCVDISVELTTFKVLSMDVDSAMYRLEEIIESGDGETLTMVLAGNIAANNPLPVISNIELLLACEEICVGSTCGTVAVEEISTFSWEEVVINISLPSSESVILSIVDDSVFVVDGISSGLGG